jgi:hypothetical protein
MLRQQHPLPRWNFESGCCSSGPDRPESGMADSTLEALSVPAGPDLFSGILAHDR